MTQKSVPFGTALMYREISTRLQNQDNGGMSPKLFIASKPIRFVPNRHLDVQAVIGAGLAALGRHSRIGPIRQHLPNHALEKVFVASDQLVDPAAWVNDSRFAILGFDHLSGRPLSAHRSFVVPYLFGSPAVATGNRNRSGPGNRLTIHLRDLGIVRSGRPSPKSSRRLSPAGPALRL